MCLGDMWGWVSRGVCLGVGVGGSVGGVSGSGCEWVWVGVGDVTARRRHPGGRERRERKPN